MANDLVIAREPDTFTLGAMLRQRRPEKSDTQKFFIRHYLEPLGVTIDGAGNVIKIIGDNPTVMWSCHTDTVHRQGGTQVLRYHNGIIRLAEGSDSNCLGADNTAGCWLMREMILAKVPGLYVFHRGEECGGIGSRHIATNTPKLLEGIKHAIALDRKGTQDVITFQWSGRCCSEEFATELAKRLGHGYKPDPTGSFTDTANYMKLVPECTNLSVGYRWEHCSSEELNVAHILMLRRSLLALRTDDLPVMRDPKVHESRHWGYDWWCGNSYGRSVEKDGGKRYGRRHDKTKWGSNRRTKGKGKHKHSKWGAGHCPDCYRARIYCQCDDSDITTTGGTDQPIYRTMPDAGMDDEAAITATAKIRTFDLVESIRRNPEIVIKLMKSYGWTENEIAADLYKFGAALIGSGWENPSNG